MLYHANRIVLLFLALVACLACGVTWADEFGIRDVTAAPVSPDHYMLRLNGTHNGSIWPIEMHIEHREGRFGRTWITGLWRLMGGNEPRLELDPGRLSVDENGIQGTAKINLIDEPQHVQSTLEIVLSLKREGERLEGTWERRFGEAGQQKPIEGDIEGKDDAPGLMALKLNGLLYGNPTGGDYVWLKLKHKDGQITEAWGEAERVFNSLKHEVDFSGIKLDGDKISGQASITLLPDGYTPKNHQPIHCVVKLDAQSSGGRITGTYSGQWNAPLTWSGQAVGLVQPESDWRAQNRVAVGGGDWPKWLGPFDNGAGDVYGQRLVDSLQKARLVWKSEDTPAGRSTGLPSGRGFADGGASSPIVKDGRVYLFYELPHGGEYDKGQEARARAVGVKGYDTKHWSILSDEVILCVDAATGRTLWKTVFPGKGLYWLPEQHVVANLSPCVFNGRVYAIGTTGRVYCADAVTGRKLWESDLGPKHDALKAYARQCLTNRRFGQHPGMPRVSTPTFSQSDDLLITTDFQVARDVWRANNGLLAFDGRTGEIRWQLDGVLGLWASPVRWTYDGKEYIIAGNVKGELRCIDPATGDTVWEVNGIGQFWNEPTVIGNYLLAPVGGLGWRGSNGADGSYARQSGCRVGCYRLNAEGAERIWMLSSRYDFPGFDNICGRNNYAFARMDNRNVRLELATGEIVAEEERDPLTAQGASPRAPRSGCGFNELWEDLWVYAPNFTDDLADGDSALLAARRFHVFQADAQKPTLLDETLMPHKRFSAEQCRGLAWPYVDGRIFVRGGDGIYCYDLRASSE